jgi:hypothetical protein
LGRLNPVAADEGRGVGHPEHRVDALRRRRPAQHRDERLQGLERRNRHRRERCARRDHDVGRHRDLDEGRPQQQPDQRHRPDPVDHLQDVFTLGRDYKRVYEDVEILSAAGLLDRTDDGGVCAGYDEIRTSISLVGAA